MTKANYKEWKGKNRFFCKGRLMTGGDNDMFTRIITFASIVGLACKNLLLFFANLQGFYFATIGVYYGKEISPAVPSVAFVLMGSCIYFVLKTMFSDPGVIPRGNVFPPTTFIEPNKDEIEAQQNNAQLPQQSETPNENQTAPLPAVQGNNQDVEAANKKENNGEKPDIAFYTTRYCGTCRIWRPPKASHCAQCDNCVRGYDHHCNFVGNCVGERTLKSFTLFLFFGALGCTYGLITAFVALGLNFGHNTEIGDPLSDQLGFWIAGGSLVLIAIFLINPSHLKHIKFTVMIIGFILIAVGFIRAAAKINLPYYKNPGIIILLIFCDLPFCAWLIGTFISNFGNAVGGFTLKEKVALQRGVKNEEEKDKLFKLTTKQKWVNLKDFILRKRPESDIEGVW